MIEARVRFYVIRCEPVNVASGLAVSMHYQLAQDGACLSPNVRLAGDSKAAYLEDEAL